MIIWVLGALAQEREPPPNVEPAGVPAAVEVAAGPRASVIGVVRRDLPLVRAELSFDVTGLGLRPGALDALDAAWSVEGDVTAGVESSKLRVACGTVRCVATLWAPTPALPAGLAALQRAVLAPKLPSDALRRWRARARPDWATDPQSPRRVHGRAVGRTLWPAGGPLREDRSPEDFRVGPGEVRRAWAAVLRAPAMLTIVGDARVDDVLVGAPGIGALGGLGEPQPSLPGPDLSTGRRIAVAGPTSNQAHVTVAWPAPDADDPGRRAWQLAFRVLAEGFTSRLNARLRENDGLTYGVTGASDVVASGAYARVDTAVAASRLGDALVAVREEIDRLRDQGVTISERLTAVQGTWREMERAASTGDTLAYAIWRDVRQGRPALDDLIHADLYQDVSLAQIQEQAARWLGGPRTWIVTAPEEALDTELPRVGWTTDTRWTACEAVFGHRCSPE